ncbi:MAG TPA: HIT domain-containing protein [Persephonella sp.]|uniref:Histidine triad n=1 Tax=Persephonella marina (strain DSM 14350 / EX-H1) TaxID=123214 RepID=C0QS70_PERMH|nr:MULTISPECIES: HIT domain-containing protein [Persephonella]ACO04005.1 histidine triad [Persephonella marina EX-H1]HCB69259.1 HIT domain-containing protein [Persephonella sp.]
MERLYSPWRSQYIETYDKIEECFLCDAYRSDDDEKKLVLYRGKRVFVIMNLFPYNAGHVMVCPNEHIGDFTQIDHETLCEISKVTQMMVKALRKALNPEGFNIGYNLGRVAGAGLEDHIHNHIVPRWNGDTNFMPVIGEVKVISQDLKDIYTKIKKAIKEIEEEDAE